MSTKLKCIIYALLVVSFTGASDKSERRLALFENGESEVWDEKHYHEKYLDQPTPGMDTDFVTNGAQHLISFEIYKFIANSFRLKYSIITAVYSPPWLNRFPISF